MNKKIIRNYLIMIAGSLLIGCGVSLIVFAALGADALTTFEDGLTRLLHISLSVSTLIANLLFITLIFLLDRKRVSIDTLLCPLFISLGVKLFTAIFPNVSAMPLRVIYMLAGLVIISLGVGVGAQSPTGSSPYDGFVLAASIKSGKDYRLVRWTIDIITLLAGILLKGSWGIGTIMSIAFIGIIAKFFIEHLKKLKIFR